MQAKTVDDVPSSYCVVTGCHPAPIAPGATNPANTVALEFAGKLNI